MGGKNVEYPKKVMGVSELQELGYGRNELLNYARIPGQTFATKTSGGGKWMFFTEDFDKWIRSKKQ